MEQLLTNTRGKKAALLTNTHLHLAAAFVQSEVCAGFQRKGGFVR